MGLGLLIISGVLYSCKKEKEKEEIPTLTTMEVTNISATSAKSGGKITSGGTDSVYARGVCWSTKISPTIGDNITQDGFGSGTFESYIRNLNSLTTYYIRAYASNNVGTAYGNELSFTTLAYLATVTGGIITNITTNSASYEGNVTSDGGAAITDRGVCWSSSFPSFPDNCTTGGAGTGTFIINLTGLTDHTAYWARAYAVNSAGVAFGGEIGFSTKAASNEIIFNPNISYGTLADVDGNTYKTVQIGSQTWMAENLKTTKCNDSKLIPLITDANKWQALTTPAYCNYNNDINYKNTYGALYNWYTVNTGTLCPMGWHIPTTAEWDALREFSGGFMNAGGKLKETGVNHWLGPTSVHTNETGFTALPGGVVADWMTFHSIELNGFWWTSSEHYSSSAFARFMNRYNNTLENGELGKYYGLSVRCVKD